jgi:hypothetical protein
MAVFYPKKQNGAKGVKRGQKEPNLKNRLSCRAVIARRAL